jgi:hypothetical protein
VIKCTQMDPEAKQLLKETLALAKDNHRMLRAMRRDQWLGFIAKVVFWLVVLILPLYFLQPYLGSFLSAAELQNVLNQYKLTQ